LDLEIERDFCDATIVPSICGGTGFYNFRWNTNEITPTITLTPTSTSTYSLTVTDGGTGNSVTQNISVGPDSEFYGNFSVYIPNVFTPNGDGINDKWEVRDANVDTGPIKAFEYDLVIVDRNGLNVYDDDGSNPNGYHGNDIFWDGKNNNGSWVVNDVYYYALTLYNCDHSGGQTYNGWVQVLGSPASSSARVANTFDEDSLTQLLTESFKFWPNPTNSEVQVDYSIVDQSALTIKLVSLEGKVIQILEDQSIKIPGRYSSQYSLRNIPAGTYLLHYQNSNYSKTQKLIIK